MNANASRRQGTDRFFIRLKNGQTYEELLLWTATMVKQAAFTENDRVTRISEYFPVIPAQQIRDDLREMIGSKPVTKKEKRIEPEKIDEDIRKMEQANADSKPMSKEAPQQTNHGSWKASSPGKLLKGFDQGGKYRDNKME